MTLAYVFWHAPQPGVVDYDSRLARFHRELRAERPAGFIRSEVVRFPSVPWLSGSPVFEEWYLVEGSVALDIINDAAVSPPLKTSHDDVARHAAAGTAGIYQLRSGDISPGQVAWNHWFAKPPGTAYATLYEMLGHLTGRVNVQLWSRYMVLGPTAEFCIRSPEQLTLPPGFTALTVAGELFFSG